MEPVTLGFPYPRPRPGQLAVAKRVAEAVGRGGAIMVQAPTGFGKTVALLYGARLAGDVRTLYVVRTRNELVQPFKEAVKLGLRPVFLYSKKAMCPLARGEKGVGVEDFWENCRSLRAKKLCPYHAALSRATPEQLGKAVWGSPDPYHAVENLVMAGFCPFYALKSLIPLARILILTYPYVFNDYIRSALGLGGLGEYVLMVDEAHSLMGVADMAERRLSERKLKLALRELLRYAPEARSLHDAVANLIELLEESPADRRYRRVDKGLILDILGDAEAWFDVAQEIRAAKLLEAPLDRWVRVRVHTLSIAYFTALLGLDEYEAFTHQARGGRAFAARPVDPSIVVADVLNEAGALVLASGTLPPPSYFSDVLGVSRSLEYLDVEEEYGPVFPPENRVTLVATYLTSRYTARSPETSARYAELLLDVYRLLPGVVLAVHPSYEFMGQVLSASDQWPVDQVVEDETTRISDVAEKARGTGRLLIHAVAGGKLTEGVELLGPGGESLVRAVVLVGVPYPQPDDYTRSLEEKLAEKVGRERAREHLLYDTAAVRVRQALGRAIRSPEDRAVYILADHRYMNPHLRSRLRLRYNKVVRTRRDLMEALEILARDFL